MKKILILIVIIPLFSGLFFAQSIRVITPKGGDTWHIGDTFTITWKGTDLKDTQVKINLFRESVAQANFVEQLTGPNNGAKKWTIGPALKPGKYALRIKGATSNIYGDSGIFNIAVKPAPPPTGNFLTFNDKLPPPVEMIDRNQLKPSSPPGTVALSKYLKPDIIVLKVILNAEEPLPRGLDNILADLILKNAGTADIPKSRIFSVILMNANNDPEGGINFGNGIKAGDIALIKNFKIPVRYQYETYGRIHYSITLDYEDAVKEINEYNNHFNFSIQIQK